VNGWAKVKSAAKYTGVSDRTFRSWLKRGLKHSRLPTGTILVNYLDIDSYLKSYSVQPDKVETIVNDVCRDFKI